MNAGRNYQCEKTTSIYPYFFIGYLVLTAFVIGKVWYDTSKSENGMVIEHIENPVLKKDESPAKLQDTLSTILKNQIYERK
jgi:hypothetical protein